MLKKCKDIFELVTVLIGTIIGAGFISGAELMQFFPLQTYSYYLIFSSIFFIGGFTILYAFGRRYGGFVGILQYIFKKFAIVVHICILLASIIITASMLAGFASALQLFLNLQKMLPLYSFLLLIIVFVVAFKGVQAVLKLNAVLVPFMVILIFCFYKFPQTLQPLELPTWSIVLKIILFVSFNLFLSAPVLCDLGKRHAEKDKIETLQSRASKEKWMKACTNVQLQNLTSVHIPQKKKFIHLPMFVAIVLATALILLAAGSILENIVRVDGATEQALPFLYTIKGKFSKILFGISAIGGILTTLFAAYYTVHSAVDEIKFALWYRLALATVAYLLSIMGLKCIIQFCYPVIGGMGIVFFSMLIVHLCRGGKKRKLSKMEVQKGI